MEIYRVLDAEAFDPHVYWASSDQEGGRYEWNQIYRVCRHVCSTNSCLETYKEEEIFPNSKSLACSLIFNWTLYALAHHIDQSSRSSWRLPSLFFLLRLRARRARSQLCIWLATRLWHLVAVVLVLKVRSHIPIHRVDTLHLTSYTLRFRRIPQVQFQGYKCGEFSRSRSISSLVL